MATGVRKKNVKANPKPSAVAKSSADDAPDQALDPVCKENYLAYTARPIAYRSHAPRHCDEARSRLDRSGAEAAIGFRKGKSEQA